MKKYLLLFVSFMVLANLPAQNNSSLMIPEDQEAYFYCDFQEGGVPEGFKFFDLDGMDYHYWALHMGFDKEKPWIWAIEKVGSNNACMASLSFYYEEKKPGNDWMVTPGIYVSPKEGKITWRSRSDMETQGVMANLKGGYSVYISTKGQNPEDFTEKAVFTVKEDDLDWQEHAVDVSGYCGQTIYVAFANQTIHTGLVLIDDIALIGEKRSSEIQQMTDKYVFGNQDVAVKCKFTAVTDVPVTSIKAYYSYQGSTYTKSVSGINLKKGESYTVEFEEKIPVSVSDTARYRIWADVNEYAYDAVDYEIVCLSFKPNRKVVIEEGTGMWCGNCPLGILAFERLAAKYPDNFIGIAVHNGDAIEDEEYNRMLGFDAFPSGTINRQVRTTKPMVVQYEGDNAYYTTMAGGFETYFLSELNDEIAAASITLTAGFKDADKKDIQAKVDYRFAKSYTNADLRFAFVLLENGVTGTGFYQNNSLSGFKGDCGGFESMGSKLANYVFQHVARGIFDSFDGISGSVPAQITVDAQMSYEHTITIPAPEYGPAIVPEKLELVVLMIDSSTGEIINADKVALEDGSNINSQRTENGIRCEVADDYCTVVLPTDISGPIQAGLIDLNGRVIVEVNENSAGTGRIHIPVHAFKGVYLLKVTVNEKTAVYKVLIK